MKKECAWEKYTKKQEEELEVLCKEYRDFLDNGKTERECVSKAVAMAQEKGYVALSSLMKENKKLKPGDKVYAVNMKKAVIFLQIGSDRMEDGMNILGAHMDSPRLDVKQNPLYEEGGFAYLDTHYYGGIKKYQWVTIPLAIHGVVVKKDGTVVNVVIGEDETDPVFFVSDLLIHLAQEQLEKKANKVIEGEALDIIVGNRPIMLSNQTEGDVNEQDKIKDKDGSQKSSEKVKDLVLQLIHEKYDLEETDFLSGELEIVPATKAREAGLDRSMILAYGQDDRSCAFTSLKAMLDVSHPKRTACCILVDKEEIGSVGATGMQSRFFENVICEILSLTGEYSDLTLRRCLANSYMLSSDVSSAYDPSFASSFDKKNVAYLGHGMVFNKFTGSRGKSGSNDANAEYIAKIRRIMDEAKVSMQTAELGKVDLGGGGTIAYILSLYGMNVIDCGVPVMNMHAPNEATSKADIYEVKRGYEAFLQADCLHM